MPSNSSQRALAPTLWPAEANSAARQVLLVLAGTLLIAVAAKIKVPFYPVPMTLQTLAILLIAATYGMRLGTLTVLAYLFEGLLGLPVFANTPPGIAGPAYFIGPTAGFLAGFVVLALVVGWAADRGWDRSITKLFAAMIVGEVIMFALGFVWLAWFAALSVKFAAMLGVPADTLGTGAAYAWTEGVAKFVLADLLKIVLAGLAVPAAWSLVDEGDV